MICQNSGGGKNEIPIMSPDSDSNLNNILGNKQK